MGLLLKQSTAVTVKIGPFIDEDDGKTAETGLAASLTQAAIRLSKNGGNMAQKNQGDACSHDELGYYDCSIDATDTGTLGRLQLMVHVSGALPVYHEYMVVRADIWDGQCSTDYMQVDVIQLGSGTQSATDLKDFADTGYNPGTHSVDLVDEVTLCATTTTNTDMITSATVNAAVDDALDTAIPGVPTANSINERIATLDTNYTSARAGYLDELAAANLPTDIANVKAETALIVADTNELQTDWANGGRLDNILDACALEATVAALNDIDADTVWDEVMDTNAPANLNSAREILNVVASVLAGKSSGGGTNTIVFRDTGDTKNRISATVDADGNRTAVGTQDGT